MENITITFQEPWFKSLEDYRKILELEYNTDTSVRHSNRSGDIVQTTSNKEDVESQNKESVR